MKTPAQTCAFRNLWEKQRKCNALTFSKFRGVHVKTTETHFLSKWNITSFALQIEVEFFPRAVTYQTVRFLPLGRSDENQLPWLNMRQAGRRCFCSHFIIVPKPACLVPYQYLKPSLLKVGITGMRTASVCKSSGVLHPHWVITPLTRYIRSSRRFREDYSTDHTVKN